MRLPAILLALVLLTAACSSTDSSDDTAGAADSGETVASTDATADSDDDDEADGDEPVETVPTTGREAVEVDGFGTAPAIPAGFDPALTEALDRIFSDGLRTASYNNADRDALETLAASGDPRVAWPIADILRFTGGDSAAGLVNAASELTGLDLNGPSTWGDLVDHLIAWDIPAPPNYVDYKRTLFTIVAPEWEPFFEDGADVDYRYWSWGGVRIDDRPFDETDRDCNCIPAADNPEVTDAADGGWYDDDRIVFGVVIDGEARAYPRNIMEVREMVNDTLGGRDIAMPYCTLCGSAQVYYTDQLPDGIERPVLRTSGLLSRSNKVMYDVNTNSVFDTFLGTALTGPLAEIGLELEQAPVVTTTWGAWKDEHPDTTILDESLTLGRDSDLLNTRDADGPIFPIGTVDPRLATQEFVLGVITGDGTPVAFPVEAARSVLLDGRDVTFDEVTIELVGDGIRARDGDGQVLPSHEAFWFAWSQFHADTKVWTAA